jgi:hypothetical protein
VDPVDREVLVGRAGLVGPAAPVGTRRFATRPRANSSQFGVPAVVKLAKYRFGPTGKNGRMPLTGGVSWDLATSTGALAK